MPAVLILATTQTPRAAQTGNWPGDRPRIDYLDLQRRLNADLIDFGIYERPPYHWLERPDRLSRLSWGQALYSLCHWQDYDTVLSLGEDAGLALAFLLRLRGWRPRHIMVAHNLLSSRKVHIVRALRVMDQFDTVVVLSSDAADGIQMTYGVPPEKIVFSMDAIDEIFWRPDPDVDVQPGLILSVGRARRDYSTLFAAVEGLPARVRVQAGSQWHIKYAQQSGPQSIPPNVEMGEYLSFTELRRLYGQAAFAVIPLERGAHHSAGSVSIKEAMAMSKAVIVAADRGVEDYVRHGETGLVVPAAEPEELRRSIAYLLANSTLAVEMGRNGRALLEREMRYEAKIDRLAELVAG